MELWISLFDEVLLIGELFSLGNGSAAVISSGYNFVTGRFVFPVDVLMLAALIRPSSPEIVSLTTARCQLIRGVSSCTRTTAPGLMV